ncbi:MAG: rhodanese-related sulfurtransferase [Melioribacteraceae bacterium]|nr:rhodanese-related sulfurtransferase [Melioribacteraceae bacterium]
MASYKVLLFYKYVEVENPEAIVKLHLEFCKKKNIRGRVFFSHEGINATVSGTTENIEEYKKHLTSFKEFEDIWFKEDEADEHAFEKIKVKIKDEIVNSGLGDLVRLENTAKRLKPEELREFYEKGKDFVIVDARNIYESEIGKFKNAITPPMETFRDWPQIVNDLKEQYKDKTVVTYCTGGIRCEKASALMVENGYSDVYQLEGGIVNFTKQFPDTFWEGSVFVFDERRIVTPNSKEEIKHIGTCYFCGGKTSYYINCHNQNCDKLLVCCHDCKIDQEYCCSDECRASDNKRARFHG